MASQWLSPASFASMAALGVLIPIVSVLVFGAIVFALLYFRHRERMAVLAQGDTAPGPLRSLQRSWLREPVEHALLWSGVGLGLSAGLWTLGTGPWLIAGLMPLFAGLMRLTLILLDPAPLFSGRSEQRDRAWLQSGLTACAIGLALLIALGTLGFGPWLLAGTVPLGVGLGRLSAYVLARTLSSQ